MHCLQAINTCLLDRMCMFVYLFLIYIFLLYKEELIKGLEKVQAVYFLQYDLLAHLSWSKLLPLGYLNRLLFY